jgi:hypothetical protein
MKSLLLLVVLVSLVSCGGKEVVTGPQGEQGIPGTPGESAFDIWKTENNRPNATMEDYLNHMNGLASGSTMEDLLFIINSNTGFFNAELIEESSEKPGYYIIKWNYIDDCCANYLGYEYAAVKLSVLEKGMNWQDFLHASALYHESQNIFYGRDRSNGPMEAENKLTFFDLDWNEIDEKWEASYWDGVLDSSETMVFEESSNTKKDLEKVGSSIEAMEVSKMEDMLVNYGLSAERSEKLGKLMVSYNKIKTKRALTGREKDVFTKELTGLSFDKAALVLAEEGYDALIEKASEANAADPEAVKELINEIL